MAVEVIRYAGIHRAGASLAPEMASGRPPVPGRPRRVRVRGTLPRGRWQGCDFHADEYRKRGLRRTTFMNTFTHRQQDRNVTR